MRARSAIPLAFVFALGCTVEPTNPFDEETPLELQEAGTFVGRIVLERDLEARPVELRVLDDDGRLLEEGGEPLAVLTRTEELGLPDGFDDDGLGAAGTYSVTLQPGDYSIRFDAGLNQEPLYLDADRAFSLAPGQIVRGDLAPTPLSLDNLDGVVRGRIEGAVPGQSFVVRLVPEDPDSGLEEKTLLQSADGEFEYRQVAPGTDYRVIVEGDGYAPQTSPTFQIAGENNAQNPFVLDPLTLVTLGRLFTVDHASVGGTAPYVGTADVPVAFNGGLLLLAPGLDRAEVRAMGRPAFEALVAAETAGDDVDPRWENAADASLIAALEEDGAVLDGDHDVVAQLRLCFDADCEEALTSGAEVLGVILDRAVPRAISVQVAGEASGALVVGCARFGAGDACPPSGPDPFAPLVEVSVDDGVGQVASWGVSYDGSEPTLDVLDAQPGLASFSGPAPGMDPADASFELSVFVKDLAGNVGAVHARDVVVDVSPLSFDDPQLVITGTESRDVDGNTEDVIPGDLITLDVSLANGDTPVRWRISRSDGALLGTGVDQLVPYDGAVTLFVSGAHRDLATVTVEVEDASGNLAASGPAQMRVWRTGDLLGSAVAEGGGAPAGLIVTAVAADGTETVAVQPSPGSFQALELLRGVYTLRLEATGLETVTLPGVVIESNRQNNLGAIELALPRGDIAGRFELSGNEGTNQNAGIQVSLTDSNGDPVAGALTLADGSFTFGGVVVGTGYVATANFNNFLPGEVTGIEVLDDQTTTLADTVLFPIEGDFRLCAPTDGKLSQTCAPLTFTNLTTLDIGGISLEGISDWRTSTQPFVDPDLGWTPVATDGDGDFIAPTVDIGQTGEGTYTVHLQLRTSPTTPGEVQTADIVFDITPPANVAVTLARGADALLDGFTNELTGRATVTADPGAGAPLGSAFVVFDTVAPGAVPAQTRCPHATPCGVPLDDAVERVHTAFAFSCDLAGNCTATPAQADIVLDTTPPRAVHGVGFVPAGAAVVQSGPDFFTRSSQYDLDVDVGAAQTDAGGAVLDLGGQPVADVVATRFGVADPPPTGNGSFAFNNDFEPFTALLAAGATLTVTGPSLPGVDSTYRVFGQLQDGAGNITVIEDNPFHVDLTLDTAPPGVSFTLDGGALFTTDTEVELTVNAAADPPVRVDIALDGGLFETVSSRAFPFALGDELFDLTDQGASADGEHEVIARFFDAAGNVIERTASILLDTTPPDPLLVECGTCSIHLGENFTNEALRTVVLDVLASDVTGDVVTTNIDGVPQPFAATAAATLADSDTAQTLNVTFTDTAGNTSAPVALVITLDRGNPAPSLSVNGGDAATPDADVELTIGAADTTSPVTGFRVSNTATFAGDFQPLVGTLIHRLGTPTVDGSKTVFLEVIDAAGNSGQTSASIVLDTAPPTGTVDIGPGLGRINTTTVDVSLSYDLADAITHVLSTSPLAADCSDAAFPGTDTPPPPSVQVTFAATGGEPEVREVYVCTRDAAGNVALASDSVILDEEGPDGAVSLDSGAAFTLDTDVGVVITAPADTVSMRTAVDAAPDCTDTGSYVAFNGSFTQTLPSAAGTHTVFACLLDNAGNFTPTALSDSIVLDLAAPSVSIAIDESAGGFVLSPVVNVAVTGSDDLDTPEGGLVGMRVGNTNPPGGALEAFASNISVTVENPTVDGTKTICVELEDAAGRTTVACDTTNLDLAAPTATVEAEGGAAFATSNPVAVRVQGDSGEFAVAQGALECESATYVAFDGDETVNVTVEGQGLVTVLACVREASGRTVLASDVITFDNEVPSAPQPVEPAAGEIVADDTPTLRWSAAAGADFYRVTIRQGGTPVRGPEVSFTTEYTETVALPDGPYTWEVVAEDNAGNTSGLDAAFPRALGVDDTPPIAAGNLTVIGGSPTNDATPTFTWEKASDNQTAQADLVYLFEVAEGTNFSGTLVSVELDNAADDPVMSFTLESPLAEGSYAWRVRVRDTAGNTTDADGPQLDIDVSAPDPTAIDPIDSPTTNPVDISWSAVAGADEYRVIVVRNPGQSDAVCGTFTTINELTTGTSRSVTFPSTTGCNYTVFVLTRDSLGNQSTPATTGFRVDTVAPVPDPGPVVVQINDGDAAAPDEVMTVVNLASEASFVKLLARETASCAAPPTVTAADFDAVTAQSWVPATTFVFPPNNAATNDGPPPNDHCKWIVASWGDLAGNFSTPSLATADSIILDTLTPDAPSIATESQTIDAADITITLATNARDHNFDSYQVRTGATGNFVDITPDNPACVDAAAPLCEFTIPLAPNRENRIGVRAIDLAGNTSAEDFVTITEDSSAPLAPANLGLTARDTAIKVRWDANSEDDLGGYELFYTLLTGFSCPTLPEDYVGGFADQGLSPIDVGNNTSFSLTGLPNGVEVCIGVRAYDETQPPKTSNLSRGSATPYELTPNLIATLSSSQLGITGDVGAVAERNGLLYVAAHNAGLIELDPTNRECYALANPDFTTCTGLVESTETLNTPDGIYLHGGYAFVADAVGAKVFRVREGTAPELTFTLLHANSRDVVASENVLAIAHAAGTSLYDLSPLYQSTPTTPTLHTTISTGDTFDVDIQGDLLAVGSNTSRALKDISDPAVPVDHTDLEGANSFRAMRFSGNTLYTIDVADTLNLFDVSSAAATLPNIGNVATEGRGDIFLDGPFVYMMGRGELTIADASNRAAPRFIGSFDLGGGGIDAGAVAVSGHRIYASSGTDPTVMVFDTAEVIAFELLSTDGTIDGGATGGFMDGELINSRPVQAVHASFDAASVVDGSFATSSGRLSTEGDMLLSANNATDITLIKRLEDGGFTSGTAFATSDGTRVDQAVMRWPFAITRAHDGASTATNAFVRSFEMPSPGQVSSVQHVTGVTFRTNSGPGIAFYGQHVYVLSHNFSTANAAHGIWRVTFDDTDGDLSGAVQVHARANVRGVQVHGRTLYFWTGTQLFAQRLEADGSWDDNNVVQLSTGNAPNVGEPMIVGNHYFSPNQGSLTLFEIDFDDTTFRPLDANILAITNSDFGRVAATAGNRVYILNLNRPTEVHLLR
jgi:hypothetical protein